MLTCNKNFVDLTVWILRSWTCIKLNIMLHQSLEEDREPGDRAMDQTEQNRHHPRTIGPDRTDPDQTGFNGTELICSEPEGAELNICSERWRWKQIGLFGTFFAKLDICLNRTDQEWVYRVAWRFRWRLQGLNCCMCSLGWGLCLMSSCTS